MGISVRVQEFTGDVVAALDGSADLGGLCALAAMAPSAYPMLSGIDPYDDTCFNPLQAAMVASELKALARQTEREPIRDAVAVLLPLVALLELAPGRPGHRRLIFIGD
jgi:hypothetical protein